MSKLVLSVLVLLGAQAAMATGPRTSSVTHVALDLRTRHVTVTVHSYVPLKLDHQAVIYTHKPDFWQYDILSTEDVTAGQCSKKGCLQTVTFRPQSIGHRGIVVQYDDFGDVDRILLGWNH